MFGHTRSILAAILVASATAGTASAQYNPWNNGYNYGYNNGYNNNYGNNNNPWNYSNPWQYNGFHNGPYWQGGNNGVIGQLPNGIPIINPWARPNFYPVPINPWGYQFSQQQQTNYYNNGNGYGNTTTFSQTTQIVPNGFNNPFLQPGFAQREAGAVIQVGRNLAVNPITGTIVRPLSGVAITREGTFYQVPGTGSFSPWGAYIPGSGTYVNPFTGTSYNPTTGLIVR
jgi:hypothetical protein